MSNLSVSQALRSPCMDNGEMYQGKVTHALIWKPCGNFIIVAVSNRVLTHTFTTWITYAWKGKLYAGYSIILVNSMYLRIVFL